MSQESANRVPELDGVRGLAILMVMFFHIFTIAAPLVKKNAFLTFLTKFVGMGWVGVDIFFVLSGFLITSILLKTRNAPDYFKNFYVRRILRIFPLYFLVILGIFLFLPVLTPETSATDQASWPYFVFYLQNWLVIPSLHLGTYSLYFSPSWSLAIEEQFYLVWPLLIFFLSRRWQVYVSVAILIFSLILRLLLVQFFGNVAYLPHFLYFGSFTNFDGFAAGALIAIAFQSEHWKRIFSRFAWPVLIITLVGIAAIVLQSGNTAPLEKDYYLNTWGYSLIVLAAGALLVVLAASPKQNILLRFFRNQPLSFFGKYSYAMYLLHYPVMLLLFYKMDYADKPGTRAWLIFVGLTFLLTILGSLLTWYLLEKPFLGLKKYFEYGSRDIVVKEQVVEQMVESSE